MNNVVKISDDAYSQLQLMIENDFTLEGKVIRLTISGKECDGFVYQIGFDQAHKDDLIVRDKDLEFHLDPFSAHYMKDIQVDYIIDPKTGEDGFVVENLNQENFTGKFFKDEEMTPKHLKNNGN